jgi:hypothetical protein
MKKLKTAHTSNSQKGMGDYYGTGIKNKVGTVKESMMITPLKKVKTPPRSLA